MIQSHFLFGLLPPTKCLMSTHKIFLMKGKHSLVGKDPAVGLSRCSPSLSLLNIPWPWKHLNVLFIISWAWYGFSACFMSYSKELTHKSEAISPLQPLKYRSIWGKLGLENGDSVRCNSKSKEKYKSSVFYLNGITEPTFTFSP